MQTTITEDEPIVTLVPEYLRDMALLVSQQDKRSAPSNFLFFVSGLYHVYL